MSDLTIESLEHLRDVLFTDHREERMMKKIILVPTSYTDQEIDELYRICCDPEYVDIRRVEPLPEPIPTNIFNLGKKDWRTELMKAAQ